MTDYKCPCGGKVEYNPHGKCYSCEDCDMWWNEKPPLDYWEGE